MMAKPSQIELPPPPTGPDRPVVLARVYPGHHEQAVEVFQRDADILAENGYFPVGQSYAMGRYSSTLVLLAAVLILFGIGLVLLLYMAAVSPPGSLAVTYVLRDPSPAPLA
jgi:hypothetical protein